MRGVGPLCSGGSICRVGPRLEGARLGSGMAGSAYEVGEIHYRVNLVL